MKLVFQAILSMGSAEQIIRKWIITSIKIDSPKRVWCTIGREVLGEECVV